MTYLYLITSAFFMLSTPFTFANESLRDNGSIKFSDHFSEPFQHLLSKKITHAIEQGELTTQEAINERKAFLNERYLPYTNKTIDYTTLGVLKNICSFSTNTHKFRMFQTLFLAGDFHHDDALNENAIRDFLELPKIKRTKQRLKKSIASRTEEEKKATANKKAQTWASHTEEEKKVIAKRRAQINKESWASRTEEQKKAISEKISQTWASKSEEEKKAISEKISQTKKRKKMDSDKAFLKKKRTKLENNQTTGDVESIIHENAPLLLDTQSDTESE